MPQLRYDRLYWLLFLALVLTILFGAVTRKKHSFADEVEVEVVPINGTEKLITEKDVRQALLRSFGNTLQGTELERLEVERVESVLEEDPFVADAETYVDQANILHVQIEQRVPALRVLDNRGGNYYLDQKGAKMPPSRNFAARVLVATGNIPPYTADFMEKKRNILKDLLLLTDMIQDDKFLSGFIQQVHVNNAGEIIMVPLIGDQQIVLGSARRLEEKLEKLKIFYKEGMPYAGWGKYRTINLKYRGQVVARR
jgi:cell division protein FtsQ